MAFDIPGVLRQCKVAPGRKYPLFIGGDVGADRAVLFVGGLFDTIGSVGYLPKLAETLKAQGWALALPHLSSSGAGFATSSLKRDCEELDGVVRHLRGAGGMKTVVMVGHSTGTQDIMAYLLSSPSLTRLDGAILQAPVSDREAFAEPAHVEAGKVARAMVQEDRGDKLMPLEHAKAFGFPGVELKHLTAYRCWSLVCPGGDDDFFSSDIPATADSGSAYRPLSDTFGRLPANIPLLFLMSGDDQYVPPSVDKLAMLERWRAACAPRVQFEGQILDGANHAVADEGHRTELVRRIVAFLERVGTAHSQL